MRGKIDMWHHEFVEDYHAPLPSQDKPWDMARYAVVALLCLGMVALGFWSVGI